MPLFYKLNFQCLILSFIDFSVSGTLCSYQVLLAKCNTLSAVLLPHKTPRWHLTQWALSFWGHSLLGLENTHSVVLCLTIYSSSLLPPTSQSPSEVPQPASNGPSLPHSCPRVPEPGSRVPIPVGSPQRDHSKAINLSSLPPFKETDSRGILERGSLRVGVSKPLYLNHTL